MANVANPVPYVTKRELGHLPYFKSHFFNKRLNAAKNLYRRDLVCHYGCVNAIEFSSNGELLISGGDDRRVMLWELGQAILNVGKPEPMIGVHQSNIFCLGITNDNQKIFSGGNDDTVIVHDVESKRPLEVLQHILAVCALSINPFNEMVVATAGNDGRLLLFDTRHSVHESLVISRSRKAFHGVMFHPLQTDMLVSANAHDGVALWDLRSPKHPVIRYTGNNGSCQNSMSVRFNSTGNLVLALRRRLAPVLYNVHSPEPIAEFYHQDYYNSCTMKSCCFAGEGDQFVVSGSDDFNLYMWKIPDGAVSFDTVVEPTHIVLYGHRSIVNQVRYNPHYCLLASSGVEKIIKVWSAMEYPQMRGCLLEEAQGSENPRELYSHEGYVSLVHHSGQYISHNYAEQSTSEDPRMMAFFDSLVQRELECLAEESDSADGSSSVAPLRSHASDSSDSDQMVADFLPLRPKRQPGNGSRSQRCSNRFARLLASRYSKNLRSQKRGSLRRSKQSSSSRAAAGMAGGAGGAGGAGTARGGAGKGKRPARACRPSQRRAPPPRPTPRSAPSSELTDSDGPTHCHYTNTAKIIRPLRRRMNLSRAAKRKPKGNVYRKSNLISNVSGMVRDYNVSNFANYDNFDDNLALPSTSTGYRGQSTTSLFRIAEIDSDDEHSASSLPVSPRSQNQNGHGVPPNLVSIVPTPINGTRDPLGDSPRVTPHRVRRRRRSASSDSPPPPKLGYSTSVARLMNETNESEVESSCSTESSLWPPATPLVTPPAPIVTLPATLVTPPEEPEIVAAKFRQRVKKTRRNYRNHMDSDSN